MSAEIQEARNTQESLPAEPSSELKSYIGAKIIQAEPEFRVKETPNGAENAPGYKVIYPDGYISWSPKDVFENAYRLITDGEKKLI